MKIQGELNRKQLELEKIKDMEAQMGELLIDEEKKEHEEKKVVKKNPEVFRRR